MNPYLTYRLKHPQWHAELDRLRDLILQHSFQETIKWGIPYYQLDGKNLIGLAAFKNFVALWFTQGALLNDHASLLINASENNTKAQRQCRFQSLDEIQKAQAVIQDYLHQTVENHNSGIEIKPERDLPVVLTGEIKYALDRDAELQSAFAELSRAKQREYSDYVQSPKQAQTRLRRLEKVCPMILAGHGLNDRYRK